MEEPEMMQSRTLLQTKPKRRPGSGVKLQKLKSTSKMSQLDKSNMSQLETGRTLDKTMAKLNDEERDFLVNYREAEKLDREKEIKFFPCIGDPAMTEDEDAGYKEKRENKIESHNEDRKNTDVSRYETNWKEDKAVVDTDIPLEVEPDWDVYRNNHFALRKRCLDMLLKSINKLVIRHRAG